MRNKARTLLRHALSLPIDERAELAAKLLASVDAAMRFFGPSLRALEDPADPDVEAAWTREIGRRVDRVAPREPRPARHSRGQVRSSRSRSR